MGGIILPFCRKQLLNDSKKAEFIAPQSKTMSIFPLKKNRTNQTKTKEVSHEQRIAYEIKAKQKSLNLSLFPCGECLWLKKKGK